MEAQVILYKRGDEVVTVIISRLNTQRHRPRFLARGFCQYRRLQLVGKKLIIVANLKPRKMRGEISQGMILSAEAPDGTLKVVEAPADMPNGAVVG